MESTYFHHNRQDPYITVIVCYIAVTNKWATNLICWGVVWLTNWINSVQEAKQEDTERKRWGHTITTIIYDYRLRVTGHKEKRGDRFRWVSDPMPPTADLETHTHTNPHTHTHRPSDLWTPSLSVLLPLPWYYLPSLDPLGLLWCCHARVNCTGSRGTLGCNFHRESVTFHTFPMPVAIVAC